MQDGSFMDLRMESHHRQSDDTVWPSFTDIMTVVVMIFLFALIVILLRNVELVKQLRATMEAERAAAEIARTTEEKRATLSSQLVDLEEQLSRLRLRLLQSQEAQQEASARLADRTQELAKTQAERDDLRSQAQKVAGERDRFAKQVIALQAQQATLRGEKQQLEQRLSFMGNDLDAAQAVQSRQQAELSRQQAELAELRQAKTGHEQELLSLKGEYSKLKKKYDRLVRPARTALGKYVVEIRYQKSGGEFLIGLREPKQDQYRSMSNAQLHERLSQLKRRWGNKLYTKIVIPDQSGLSYSEAWQFTNDVLSRYDYYYQ